MDFVENYSELLERMRVWAPNMPWPQRILGSLIMSVWQFS